ncbi:Serine chemoreceptor protein [Serratia rubidaea]|uniref:Serine chemoreceptor protein n=1 Tax=Serratia rubidaea TaxID=61652 RepID=A0A4U9H8U1_SERRU|nr:Serine chemoreceptor protein [Serratia rubidaea]
MADATVGRIYGYLAQSQREMATFVGVGTVTERGKTLSERLQASYRAYQEQGVRPMADAIKAGQIDEYYRIQETRISKLSIAFENDLSEFRRFAMETGQQQVREAEGNASTKIALIVAAGILSVLLAVLAWFALRLIILRPLDASIAELEHIANGDLTRKIRGEGDTEMGRLIRAMQRMQQSLVMSVSKVRDASSQIDVGSRELAAGNVHLAQRTEESAASLEETAASMEQLTSTVKMNAEKRRAGQPAGAQRVRRRRPRQRRSQPGQRQNAGDYRQLPPHCRYYQRDGRHRISDQHSGAECGG